MKILLSGVMLVATLLTSFAAETKRKANISDNQITINTEWNSTIFDCEETDNVVELRRKLPSVANSAEETSKLTVNLEYGDAYGFKNLAVVDDEGVTIKSISATTAWDGPYNNLKNITLDVPDGVFSVVATFMGKTRVYHITENVKVHGEASLTIDPTECKNEISFRAFNNKGERFITEQYEIDRYGNKTPTGFKNSYVTYHGIALYVNGRYFVGASSGELSSTIDNKGNIYNGEEEWNICVNEFSNASGVVGFTLAITPEGTYAISLPADGCGTQTVTNDYSRNITREVSFVPTRNRRRALNSKVTTHSYATSMDIIEGKGENMNIAGMGTAFIHFQSTGGDDDGIPEIAETYILNEQDPANTCPLLISTTPSSDELLVFNVNTSKQNKYYTTGQPFISHDCVKVYPSINGYAKTDDQHNYVYPFNDNYQYSTTEPLSLGGNVPILTFGNGNVVSKMGPWAYTGMDFKYIGRYGESRESDKFFTTVTRSRITKSDDESLSGKLADYSEFGVISPVLSEFEKIHMTFHNDNTNVGGMKGINDTEINYYCNKVAQYSPLPVLRMLQIREGEKVTEHISDAENATLALSVGNFKANLTEIQNANGEWLVRQKWYEYWDVPFDVKVEYSPYGSGEWRPFVINEVEDQFQPRGWGRFFSGSFGQIDVYSSNDWYDLRVSITYDEKNNQTQTLSPAFNLKSGSEGIENVLTTCEGTPTYYNLQGLKIENPSNGQLVIEVKNGKSIKKIYR